MPQIDTNWPYCDLPVVRLENELISLDILPDLGAKIYRFIHKPTDRNLLWHNPHVRPRRLAYGASFDDHWSGGWDELLPNDVPRTAPGGDMLPDHGEFWSQEADWEILMASSDLCEIRFSMHGRVLPTRFDKVISLGKGEPFVRIRYTYANLGPQPIDFLWNIHPALAVSPASRIDLPASRGITDPWREDRFSGNTSFRWPHVTDRDGREVDLRQVPPPEAHLADMHYLIDVDEGWYAVTDGGARVGFALAFPTSIFPHVWLFRTLGGWRGLYTLILEASTGYPTDLDVARKNGTCGHLAPWGQCEAEVLAIAYSGVSSVSKVTADGRIVSGESQP